MATENQLGYQKKKIIGLSLTLIAIVASAYFIFYWFTGAKSSSATESDGETIESRTPTSTRRPSPTPTETPIPTSTPLPIERVAKCKDSGDAEIVQLAANWQVGETRSLSVARYRQRIIRRKASVIVQSQAKYRIRVIEASPSGYTLEWNSEDSQVQKGNDTRNLTVDDMFLQDMLTLRSGLQIIYETDANGAYKQIKNWDQVLAFHEQLHELFKLRLEQIVKNEKTRNKVLAAIESVWTDHAQIEQLYSQEIRAYHGAYGLSVGGIQGLRRADTLPNLLGYFPLEAETEVSLATYNGQAACAFLDLRRYLSPSSIPQLLRDFLTRQTQISSRSSSTSEMSSTRIEDNVRYSVDLNSSWLQGAQLKRVTMVESLNMIDGIIVTDITDGVPK